MLTKFAVILFQDLMLLGLGHKLRLTFSEPFLDVKILLFYETTTQQKESTRIQTSRRLTL